MNSFVVYKEAVNGNKIIIQDSTDVNHIRNVLRMTEGESIRIVDGEFEYIGKITQISKKDVSVEYAVKNSDNYSLNTKIDAAISIIKNDKMDLVIQKLTEIGISKIIPMITKRSVVKIDEKKDKWEKISREAQKQCRGIKSLEIENPIKISELEFEHYDKIVVPYEKEGGQNLLDVLKGDEIRKVLFIIGPEGGFEETEIEYLVKNGAEIVTLGKRILRAETAAVVTGGILANALQ